MSANTEVTLSDVKQAIERIKPYAHDTPVITSQAIDSIASSDDQPRHLYFKCEQFQKVRIILLN